MFIFHQNMRNFGGSQNDRLRSAMGVFGRVSVSCRNDIAIAGLTEITNNVTASRVVPLLFRILLSSKGCPQGHSIFNICCGISLLSGRKEYVSIGIHGSINVISLGRVYMDCWRELKVDCVCMDEDYSDWCEDVPKDMSADYRCIVYTIVEINNQRIAFGFVHNIYTNKAIRAFHHIGIPQYLHKIKEGEGCSSVYIGGDFNARPPGVSRISRRYMFYTYYNGMDVSPLSPSHKFTPGGTLMSGNLYDYWYSDAAGNFLPGIHSESITEGLSDHCGISLSKIIY